MALKKTTQFANRLGLDLKLYEYDPNGNIPEDAEPVVVIDFANETTLTTDGDIVWATGGQTHANRVGFRNPTEGTLKISTQLLTMQVLALMTNEDVSEDRTSVTFTNDAKTSIPKYFIIVGDTLYQDKDGNRYAETVTCYKAFVQPGQEFNFTGDGDPQSTEITFQLATNDDNKLINIKFADEAEDEEEAEEPEEPTNPDSEDGGSEDLDNSGEDGEDGGETPDPDTDPDGNEDGEDGDSEDESNN